MLARLVSFESKKNLNFVVKLEPAGFEVRDMSAAADGDIAFDGCVTQLVVQPMSILVFGDVIPFTPNDENRDTDLGR